MREPFFGKSALYHSIGEQVAALLCSVVMSWASYTFVVVPEFLASMEERWLAVEAENVSRAHLEKPVPQRAVLDCGD